MKRLFLAEAGMPSPPPLCESWRGDKARQRTAGTRPGGTHPLPILTHTVSVQLLLVPSWPVAHRPSPPPRTAGHLRAPRSDPPGPSLPLVVRVWLDWMRRATPGRISAGTDAGAAAGAVDAEQTKTTQIPV